VVFEGTITLELLSNNHGYGKLPLDWEKLEKHMTYKVAYLIKMYNIFANLIVNIHQIGTRYIFLLIVKSELSIYFDGAWWSYYSFKHVWYHFNSIIGITYHILKFSNVS
jgi:hypothetical protein